MITANKHTAIYVRVSTSKQNTRGQESDLKKWVTAHQQEGEAFKYYTDKASGKTDDRPGWKGLMADIERGAVVKIVCWRLDRLGRNASGLVKLFEELNDKGVGLVSLKDSIDLSTASGRLVANVLASVAAFETELRGERIAAGIQAARESGKKLGGGKLGRLVSVKPEQVVAIHGMRSRGSGVTEIARTTSLSRTTIYRVLDHLKSGVLKAV